MRVWGQDIRSLGRYQDFSISGVCPDGRLQAGKMVGEEYDLKAVIDGERHPELLLLGHSFILAAGKRGVNFPARRLQCSAQEDIAHPGRLWYALHDIDALIPVSPAAS